MPFPPARFIPLILLLLLPDNGKELLGQLTQKVTVKQARTLGPKFAISRFGVTTIHLLGLNDDEPYPIGPDYTFLESQVDTTALVTEGMKARYKVYHRDSSVYLHDVYFVKLLGDSAAELVCDARKRYYEPWIRTAYDSSYMSVRGNLLKEKSPDGTTRFSTIQSDRYGKRFIWRELGKTELSIEALNIDRIVVRNQSKLFRTKGGKFLYDFAWGTAGLLVQMGVLVTALVLAVG
jgi:hypothetical protein